MRYSKNQKVKKKVDCHGNRSCYLPYPLRVSYGALSVLGRI